MAEQGNSSEVALKVEGVGKSFGGVRALDGLDLELRAGEVLALVGDNGAGKSTFIKIVSGLYIPTEGHILLNGQRVEAASTAEARALGIETVYQDTGLVDVMDLGGNFFLGRELLHPNPILRAFGVLDKKRMHSIAHESITRIGAKFTGTHRKPVGLLSGGQRASILIGRAAHFGSKLLLLDEPTAALGVEQTAAVGRIVRAAAEAGLPIIIISHNIEEVFDVADRIAVLRLGNKVADVSVNETTREEIVGYITGAVPASA